MALMGLICVTVSSPASKGSMMLWLVISASGVPLPWEVGSGEAEALGVGKESCDPRDGGASGVFSLLALRGATLFLVLLTTGFLTDSWGSWITVDVDWSGSRISLGSVGATLLRGRLWRGVDDATVEAVFLLPPVVRRLGASSTSSVNSSSLLSRRLMVVFAISSSSESIIAVRRAAAARRDGLADMVNFVAKWADEGMQRMKWKKRKKNHRYLLLLAVFVSVG